MPACLKYPSRSAKVKGNWCRLCGATNAMLTRWLIRGSEREGSGAANAVRDTAKAPTAESKKARRLSRPTVTATPHETLFNMSVSAYWECRFCASGLIPIGFSRNGLPANHQRQVPLSMDCLLWRSRRSAAIDECMGDGAQIYIFQFAACRHAPGQAGHAQTLLANHL